MHDTTVPMIDAQIFWHDPNRPGELIVCRRSDAGRAGRRFYSDFGASVAEWAELEDGQRFAALCGLFVELVCTVGVPAEAARREFSKIPEFRAGLATGAAACVMRPMLLRQATSDIAGGAD